MDLETQKQTEWIEIYQSNPIAVTFWPVTFSWEVRLDDWRQRKNLIHWLRFEFQN